MLDLVIRGGTVIDGSGGPPAAADVGVLNGRIVEIGAVPGAASDVLSAAGRVVAPGFIDVHVHVDALLFADPDYAAGLRQGVTSVVVGNDGIGIAPATAEAMPNMRRLWAGILGSHALGRDALTIRDYLAALDGGVAPNVGYLLPHGPLRMATMGLEARPASRAEIAEMTRNSDDAYAAGALGLSIGLDYVPCRSAADEEFVSLAHAAATWGGPFVTHMRDYLDQVEASVAEALAVGVEAGAAVHISHFNVATERALPLVDRARADGRDVTFDLYPYLAGAPALTFFLPGWVQEGGVEAMLARLGERSVRERLRSDFEAVDRRWGWDRIVITDVGGATEYGGLVGRSVRHSADQRHATIVELVADLLLASGGAAATVTHHRHRDESDQARLIGHPGHIGASDGVYVGARPHPRGFGTFARYLAMATKDGDPSALPALIRHLTTAAADRFGLWDRGRIAVGAAADIVVFDPDRICDRATYDAPTKHPDGIDHVTVNGAAVIREGQPTGRRPGRVLRRI